MGWDLAAFSFHFLFMFSLWVVLKDCVACVNLQFVQMCCQSNRMSMYAWRIYRRPGTGGTLMVNFWFHAQSLHHFLLGRSFSSFLALFEDQEILFDASKIIWECRDCSWWSWQGRAMQLANWISISQSTAVQCWTSISLGISLVLFAASTGKVAVNCLSKIGCKVYACDMLSDLMWATGLCESGVLW